MVSRFTQALKADMAASRAVDQVNLRADNARLAADLQAAKVEQYKWMGNYNSALTSIAELEEVCKNAAESLEGAMRIGDYWQMLYRMNTAIVLLRAALALDGTAEPITHPIATAPDLLEAAEAVLAAVSPDVYRIAAAQFGRADEADEALARLRAAVKQTKDKAA